MVAFIWCIFHCHVAIPRCKIHRRVTIPKFKIHCRVAIPRCKIHCRVTINFVFSEFWIIHKRVQKEQNRAKLFLVLTPWCKIHCQVAILRCNIHCWVPIPRCKIHHQVAIPWCIIHRWAEFLSNISVNLWQKTKSSQGTSNGTRSSFLMKKTNTKNLVTLFL